MLAAYYILDVCYEINNIKSFIKILYVYDANDEIRN